MTSFTSLLSVRSTRMYDSKIQEMMELVHSFNALSFTAGEPSADLIPQKRIKDAFSKAFECGEDILGYYHDIAGHVGLREWIASWMKAEGLMPANFDRRNILLTVGSQEGLSLFTEAVIDPGDIVVTEDPSYPEAFLAFEKEGAVLRTIPMDKEGPSAEALKVLAEEGGIKCFYTIPCYQNPSGKVTSLDRRKEILNLAKKFNFLILEDDPYRHLWFDEMPPSSYLSLPQNDGRVIYLGSFSKIVAPGIRCG
ncbi:MAG: PLP-dependent aminotransferase family protein, partial [Thermovirga sp.]|nr:PLP-dependent aminotransferase family protein [Thermovirga sp.]